MKISDNKSMVKTYEIELEEELVKDAEELFGNLGIDIDTAIKLFLKQAVLRKGLTFDVVIPGITDCEEIHGGVTEEEEIKIATTDKESVPLPPLSPEIEARVAANEALVAQMRNEIGEKQVVPEFDENEDDGTHGDYDYDAVPAASVNAEKAEAINTPEAEAAEECAEAKAEKEPEASDRSSEEEPAAAVSAEAVAETTAEEKNDSSETVDESEEEDETTPDNLFDAWDTGDEEEIGCR